MASIRIDGNPAALKAKLQPAGYDGDGDIVGAVIGVTVHPTAADIHVDYGVALLAVRGSGLASMLIRFPGRRNLLRTLNNYVLLRIASGRCVCVYVSGR